MVEYLPRIHKALYLILYTKGKIKTCKIKTLPQIHANAPGGPV
jgi:hypothetical protein